MIAPAAGREAMRTLAGFAARGRRLVQAGRRGGDGYPIVRLDNSGQARQVPAYAIGQDY